MKLRELVEKEIIDLTDVVEICINSKRYWRNFEKFLDYEIEFISPEHDGLTIILKEK